VSMTIVRHVLHQLVDWQWTDIANYLS
jgi:hypothetical protein